MKKILALIMSIALVFCVMSISASAEDDSENSIVITDEQTDFVFENDVSSEFQSRFIADYYNVDSDTTETYGLTCTLFGHNLETSNVSTVTHKVSSTDPRCLKEYFTFEACSRCDYSNSTLISSVYISCC